MIRSAVLVTSGAWLLAACGGSVEFRADPGGAAGTSAGGSVSAGASFGGASSGNTSFGGASGGSTSSGGAGVDCTQVACTAIGCGPGFKSILQPGACCPTCVPDGSGGGGGSGGNPCAFTTCPRPLCTQGFMYADVPGQCCGSCVPDPNACSNAQAEYRALRDKLLAAPEATSCAVDADCQWLATNAACGDPCPSSTVSVKAAAMIEPQLADFAESSCSSCPVTLPPCAAPLPSRCSAGKCSLGIGGG